MITWYRDTESNRLVKVTTESFCGSLFDSFEDSPILRNMAENESIHGDNDLNNEQPLRTMREYLQPPRNSSPSCFIFPLNANNFRFKSGMIPLLPTFHGLESESPYLHLKELEEVCATL